MSGFQSHPKSLVPADGLCDWGAFKGEAAPSSQYTGLARHDWDSSKPEGWWRLMLFLSLFLCPLVAPFKLVQVPFLQEICTTSFSVTMCRQESEASWTSQSDFIYTTSPSCIKITTHLAAQHQHQHQHHQHQHQHRHRHRHRHQQQQQPTTTTNNNQQQPTTTNNNNNNNMNMNMYIYIYTYGRHGSRLSRVYT